MVIWTECLVYRARLRAFDLEQIENILKYTDERYLDRETGRFIAIGRLDDKLVLIAYEVENADIIPVTVHAVSRQQIRYRLRSGRLKHE